MAHFIPCHKTDDASKVAYLYCKEFVFMGLVSKSTKDWDVKLAYSEFAYNRSPTYATRCSLFEVVYGVNPRVPIDLIPFPSDEVYHVDAKEKAQVMLKLHAQVMARIKKVNTKYQQLAKMNRGQHVFKVGKLVWLHLMTERFLGLRKNKLMPHSDGLFKIVYKVNDSAFKLDSCGDYSVSATVNVGDLAPYVHDDYMAQLRSIISKEEEDYDYTGVVDASLLSLVHTNVSVDLGSIEVDEGLFMGMNTW
ncbi:uncharacterized protein LOC125494404 [Beta vulgaris subsp. vulgaris]|uniref:uncharacterized protein LOC125494404 n=1 Tax=Beta vulgaris subsp. vulgaris TaxID=3555 RepID=UPI002036B019|nr:uncharacterized protein LOC125494404 [Beta vulgaris subsp. vulgaris]